MAQTPRSHRGRRPALPERRRSLAMSARSGGWQTRLFRILSPVGPASWSWPDSCAPRNPMCLPMDRSWRSGSASLVSRKTPQPRCRQRLAGLRVFRPRLLLRVASGRARRSRAALLEAVPRGFRRVLIPSRQLLPKGWLSGIVSCWFPPLS